MKIQQTGSSLLILILILFLLAPAHADLVATVDRTIISDADLISLTVRASDATADTEPDFTVLERDFEVISISPKRNSQFRIVNGQTSSVVYVDYAIVLAPRRLGDLMIPAIRAGRETTQAIPVRVQQQSISQRQQMNQYVFFETSVDKNDTYVQGQILYTVKLFYTEAIGGDFPQPPILPETVVEVIENERRYESVVSGKRYYVLEKRYAIFPQRSGELVIPRERFRGTRGRGGFFSQKQQVNAVSESHRINVRRIPEGFSGDDWIPARALTITESWTETPPQFRVGEPVNRVITLAAQGLSSSILPSVSDMSIEGAKVYADPPATENRVGAEGLTAIQQTTIGIVPTVEGRLDLPEIRIPWWNTETDREEVAVIPAATFTVMPALGEAVDVPTVTVPVTELSRPVTIQAESSPLWQWAAVSLGILWLLTAWQWLMLRRRIAVLESANSRRFETTTFVDPDEAREYKGLKQACQRNRAADAHRQLFLWCKARYPQLDSADQLKPLDDALADEIDTLERHLYGRNNAGSWRGAELLKCIDRLKQQTIEATDNRMLAADLNPV